MKKLLITGIAGFIGSSLTEKLINNYSIVGIDDFNDYYAPYIKEKNIISFLKNPHFKLHRGDIRNQKLLRRIFAENKIDKIIHLAARAGVRPSLIDPALYMSTNVIGTNLLLEAAKNNKIKQFIFASSSSVYGNNDQVPFSESDPAEYPISPYAISKIAGEKLCWFYHHTYGLPVTILRFFSVYGPKGRPDMAPYIFTKNILNHKPIEVYGNGSQARDFTFIDDIVNGIIKSLHKTFSFEIINLGNSYPISVKELIKTIENVTGKKAKIRFRDERKGDVEKTFANIAKAKKMLNWEPKMKIKEGIEKFIETL